MFHRLLGDRIYKVTNKAKGIKYFKWPGSKICYLAILFLEVKMSTSYNPVQPTSTGGGSSSNWQISWLAAEGFPPNSNYATYKTRNGHGVLNFDDTTDETTYFHGVIPANYSSSSNIIVELWVAAASATTGTAAFVVAIERVALSGTGELDIDADSFDSDLATVSATVDGTSGVFVKLTFNISNANADDITAGDAFRLKVTTDNATADVVGDVQLLRVVMRQV